MTTPARGTMTEDYLRVIWKAREWSGGGITTNEIAAELGVVASSVSGNLSKLARDGYLDYEPYGPIRLSALGETVAVRMVRRHRIIETYLVEVHGYSWDEVHAEAEVLEHAISDRLLELWDDMLGNPMQDPHGDPIPRRNGTVAPTDGRRLHELGVGESTTVLRVSDHDPELLRFLADLGVVVGTALRVQAKHDFAGMMTVIRSAPGAGDRSIELATLAANSIWVGLD
ncbi:metal-dependent transcriptional regulator [Cryobacterium algoricola]|uniref:Manganese transport regulator n=1 Tax=Cryobacterium algoricola TaxID=1259183 RepID=A0ABY2IAI6_9MICO|nr:metal-dependent transcriptional regulator [Cryobacterium algoricola]TFB83645.1 metal-dependent transcriptional regulator [Cryobacterium algoricola]